MKAPLETKVPGADPATEEAAPAPRPERKKPGPKAKAAGPAEVVDLGGRRKARDLEASPMTPLPDPVNPIQYDRAMELIRAGKLKPPVFTDRGYIVE